MKLAVDVQYYNDTATVGGVSFENWQDDEAQREYVSAFQGVMDYEPGKFYKRELPCILKLITEHELRPECIIVDGFVFLDGFSEAGLGKHLFDALGGKVSIIGVAKKRFKDINSKYEVYRGVSKNPLYVTAVGLEIEQARENIRLMHGRDRLPTLLKHADQICRNQEMGFSNE